MMNDEWGRIRDELESGRRLRLSRGRLTLSATPPPGIIRGAKGALNRNQDQEIRLRKQHGLESATTSIGWVPAAL